VAADNHIIFKENERGYQNDKNRTGIISYFYSFNLPQDVQV
jgi:hypothetical protein